MSPPFFTLIECCGGQLKGLHDLSYKYNRKIINPHSWQAIIELIS